MYIVNTLAPSIEPLLIADAKLHARVDIVHDDALFTANIINARKWVESYCAISLITQSWKVMFDYRDDFFLKRTVRLPMSPISSIASVKTYDKDGNLTVFAPSNYFLSNNRIALANNCYWPTDLRYIDCLEINIVAGFGASATSVPTPIILAMKELVTFWNEKRMPINDSLSSKSVPINDEIPFSVKSLLQPYRNYYL